MLKSNWFKIVLLSLGVLVAALGAGWFLVGPDWRALIANPPAGRDVLFWSSGAAKRHVPNDGPDSLHRFLEPDQGRDICARA